jgi:hypothetical protein
MDLGYSLRRAVFAAVLALVCVLPVSSAAAGSFSERPLVLDAYSPTRKHFTPPVSSRSTLARGHLYVATVRGSVSFYEAVDYVALQAPWRVMCGTLQRAPLFGSAGGSGRVGNDAEFIFALPLVGNTCVSTRLPRSYTNFQANGGQGWEHPSVLGRDTPVRPSPSHTYEFALTGVGEPVSFRVLDPDTRDDYGSFRIYLRKAVTGDCAGGGHSAFGLSGKACLAATATSSGPPPRLPAVPKNVALDQAPVARVLRSSDVSAVNQEVPSGALMASQFATLDNSSRSAARAENSLLQTNGFRAAAISQFASAGLPSLKSTAVKLSSPQRALVALQQEVALAARTQAPAGATVSTGRDTHLPQGYILTFTASAGGVGGLELLASAGKYLYTLRAVANPGSVSQPAEEQLLRAVLARG